MDSTTAPVAAKVCLLRAVGSGFSSLPRGLQNTVRKGARRTPILSTPLSALVLDRRVNEGTIDPADPWQARNNGGQADELNAVLLLRVSSRQHGTYPTNERTAGGSSTLV